MRGDSRRDLYAKTMALLGLGVLAGAGALVDYWPVGVKLPLGSRVESPSITSALPGPFGVPDRVTVAAPRGQAPVARPRTPTAAPVLRSRDTAVSNLEFATLPLPEFDASFGDMTELADVPPPVLTVASRAVSARMFQPDRIAAPAASPEIVPVTYAFGDADDSGFLTDAFRKTGSSLAKTGAKTGSSLVGAVRVVGSAVRRAWPN